MLSPGQLNRLSGQQEGVWAEHVPAYLVDLEQNPGTRADWSGANFPCQLTHGTVFSITKGRLVLAAGSLLANGWSIMNHPSRFSSPLSHLLSTLAEHELKFLSGIGMALQALGAWFLYVAMHTCRISSWNVVSEFSLASGLMEIGHSSAGGSASSRGADIAEDMGGNVEGEGGLADVEHEPA